MCFRWSVESNPKSRAPNPDPLALQTGRRPVPERGSRPARQTQSCSRRRPAHPPEPRASPEPRSPNSEPLALQTTRRPVPRAGVPTRVPNPESLAPQTTLPPEPRATPSPPTLAQRVLPRRRGRHHPGGLRVRPQRHRHPGRGLCAEGPQRVARRSDGARLRRPRLDGGHVVRSDLDDVAVGTVLRRMKQLPLERLAAAIRRRRLRSRR